jgi:hypothetical protein
MNGSLVIKGNVIDISKIEMIVVNRKDATSGMYYYIQFNLDSGREYKAGVFDRNNTLSILATCLGKTKDEVEPIILNAEYIAPIVPSEPEKQTADSFTPIVEEETDKDSE